MNIHLVNTGPDDPYEDPAVGAAAQGQARARREGSDFDELAYRHLEQAGADIVLAKHRVGAVPVDARIRGTNGNEFWVLAHGNVDIDHSGDQPGLRRTDTIRKAGLSAALLHRKLDALPVLLLTSHLPTTKDKAAIEWLHELRFCLFDVIAVHGDLAGFQRLHRYLAATPPPQHPEPAEWTAAPWQQLTFDNAGEWQPDA